MSRALERAIDYAEYASDDEDAATNVECAIAWALVAIAEALTNLKPDGKPKAAAKSSQQLPCPDCGDGPFGNRGALGSHRRNAHRTRDPIMPNRPPATEPSIGVVDPLTTTGPPIENVEAAHRELAERNPPEPAWFARAQADLDALNACKANHPSGWVDSGIPKPAVANPANNDPYERLT